MLDRHAIAARLPHAGRMCLLERVTHWDERRIECVAVSHRDADNPLRTAGGLPAWAGIEYAAQAAAVHGSLLQEQAEPRSGVLAALRNVSTTVPWLDRIDTDLRLCATLLHREAAGGIYRFEVISGAMTLLSGQFTLMFRDPKLGGMT